MVDICAVWKSMIYSYDLNYIKVDAQLWKHTNETFDKDTSNLKTLEKTLFEEHWL